MTSEWLEHRLSLGMPHLVGGRLSEVELLKQLGALQWRVMAGLAGRPEHGVLSEAGERLHFSMISAELQMPAGRTWEEYDEGTELMLRHRVGVFGRKLVEGMFLFDHQPIGDEALVGVTTRDELARAQRPWAYVTHGFVTRSKSSWVRLETPQALLERPVPELAAMPVGIGEHVNVERGGEIDGIADWDAALPLPALSEERLLYAVSPESDQNLLGQVYCARFPAILGSGERRLLRERLDPPLSAPLVACLSTEHRRLYYFANASLEETLHLRVEARALPASGAPGRVRTLGRFFFRTDLHRGSDGVLMASGLVRQVLMVPGQLKPVLTEAERFFGRLARSA